MFSEQGQIYGVPCIVKYFLAHVLRCIVLVSHWLFWVFVIRRQTFFVKKVYLGDAFVRVISQTVRLPISLSYGYVDREEATNQQCRCMQDGDAHQRVTDIIAIQSSNTDHS